MLEVEKNKSTDVGTVKLTRKQVKVTRGQFAGQKTRFTLNTLCHNILRVNVNLVFLVFLKSMFSILLYLFIKCQFDDAKRIAL